MAYFQFTRTQKIPADKAEVWDFICRPANLKKITPGHMGFEVTGNSGGGRMYAGMIITYKVRPFAGIPVKWVTEITHVEDKSYFVDEQRMGPYKFWHHQHRIEAVEGGVLMTDIVTYIPPFGFIGSLANSLFIKRKLAGIFDFRTKAIERIFGAPKQHEGL